eukprot:g37275.t1
MTSSELEYALLDQGGHNDLLDQPRAWSAVVALLFLLTSSFIASQFYARISAGDGHQPQEEEDKTGRHGPAAFLSSAGPPGPLQTAAGHIGPPCPNLLSGSALQAHRQHAWRFWNTILPLAPHQTAWVCAPMVRGSELAFRQLVRRHGVHLAYTPMIDAHNFSSKEEIAVLEEQHCGLNGDRPLIVQLCGNDPKMLIATANEILQRSKGRVDAFDINFGCPLPRAKERGFGSHLLHEVEVCASLVSALAREVPVPVTCKIRILPTQAETINLAKHLEAAGCSLLAVHGRTRDMKHEGSVDVDQIKAVKANIGIPVIANGGVNTQAEAVWLQKQTGCDGVMVGYGLLREPIMFDTATIDEYGTWEGLRTACRALDLNDLQPKRGVLEYKQPTSSGVRGWFSLWTKAKHTGQQGPHGSEALVAQLARALHAATTYIDIAGDHTSPQIVGSHLVRILRPFLDLYALGDNDGHNEDGTGWTREKKFSVAREKRDYSDMRVRVLLTMSRPEIRRAWQWRQLVRLAAYEIVLRNFSGYEFHPPPALRTLGDIKKNRQ